MAKDDQNNPYDDKYAKDFGAAVNKQAPGKGEGKFLKNEKAGSASNINSLEEKGADPQLTSHKNNFTKQAVTKRFFTKKKGIAGGAGIALGLLGMLGFLGSNFLMPLHVLEQFLERHDMQFASSIKRNRLIQNKKISSATKGCASDNKISLRCKYTTMSKKKVEKLRQAGIQITPDKPNAFGRYKPKAFIFEGREIPAKTFLNEMATNQEFNARYLYANNTRFDNFRDAIFNKVKAKFGFTTRKIFKDTDTREERNKRVTDATKNNTPDNGTGKPPKEGEKKKPGCTGDDCEVYTKEDVDKYNKDYGDNKKLLDDIKSKGKGSLVSLVKITGPVDKVCNAFNVARAISLAAKVIQKRKFIAFTMSLIPVIHAIKAGDATAEDVQYIGEVFNTTFTDEEGNKIGTATESGGMQYALHGYPHKVDTAMSYAMVGGLMTGKFTKAMDDMLYFIGGKKAARATCGTLDNTYVQIGSFIAGALITVTGVGALIKGVSAAAAGLAVDYFLEKLTDYAVRVLTSDGLDPSEIKGEYAGNVITSGLLGLFGSIATAGGNLPLSPSQQVDYKQLTLEENAKYARAQSRIANHWDVMNQYSFAGNLRTSYTKVAFSDDGSFNPAQALKNIAVMPFKSLTNTVYAVEKNEYPIEAYQQCNDESLGDIGAAAGPLCNPVYGMPRKFLDAHDQFEVLDYMIKTKNIDEYGVITPDSDYEKFLKYCNNRQDPLGVASELSFGGLDDDDLTGASCVIDDDTKLDDKKIFFALYQIDNRHLAIDEGETPEAVREENVAEEPDAGDNNNPGNTTPGSGSGDGSRPSVGAPVLSGNRPSATNRGVKNKGALRPFSGTYRSKYDGEVIENLDINGRMIIQHKNVVVRNVRVTYTGGNKYTKVVSTTMNGAPNLLLEDIEVYSKNPTTAAIFTHSINTTIRRAYIHGEGDGYDMWHGGLIEDSYISMQKTNNPLHMDGIQASGKNNLTIRNNTIWMPSSSGGNATILIESFLGGSNKDRVSKNVTIANNWLGGGNYVLFLTNGKKSSGNYLQNLSIRNNTFSRKGVRYGYLHFKGITGAQAGFVNNKFEDGSPVKN